MIEQFLQTSIDFAKEIWFQLEYRFQLEDTEVFKFLEPYLIQLQDNPLYIAASIAAFFLVPYSLIKIRSLSRGRERKLDELIEEMEEEYAEDDPRRLRRSESNDKAAPPPSVSEEKDSSPYIKILDEIETVENSGDLEPFKSPAHKETIQPTEGTGPINSQLMESEFDKNLEETKEEYHEDDPRRLRRSEGNDNAETPLSESEFDENLEETKEEYHEDDPRRLRRSEGNDNAETPLSESEFDENLNELIALEENIEPTIDDAIHDQAAIKQLQKDIELTELRENHSEKEPFANNSKPDEDEQDKDIIGLKDEMERAINQLTEPTEEPKKDTSSTKDLNQIHIDGDPTVDKKSHDENFFLEDVSVPETESLDTQNEESFDQDETSISEAEILAAEILASLEPDLEEPMKLDEESELETEDKAESLIVPKTRDYESELSGFTFEAEPDISSEELEISAQQFTSEAKSVRFDEPLEPKLDTERSPLANDLNPSEGSDSLIDRLKFLQTRFENRFQPTEQTTAKPSTPTEKSIPVKDYARFTEPRRYSSAALSPDSKKYMDLLESFVFMKDQKNK